jgi:hypothetical protein
MIGRLLASSISLKGQPDASVGPSLAGLVGQALFREISLGEPTKKATRGLRPRMAFMLAGVTGADQAPMSPELVVQWNYTLCWASEKNVFLGACQVVLGSPPLFINLHRIASPTILGSPQIVLLGTFCSIDHCNNDRFDGRLKAGPNIHYLGEVRREAADWKGIEGDRHHYWHLVTWELT